MIPVTFLNNHSTTTPWIFRCFLLLCVVNHSGAQGIPTPGDTAGLISRSSFQPWPSCATNCSLQAALTSSIEYQCVSAFIGACMQTASFVRMTKFCSLVGSLPCPADQCIFPPEPEMLDSWVNRVCDLTAEEQKLWKDSTYKRKAVYQKLKPLDSIGNRPSCSDGCSRLVTHFESSLVAKSRLNTTKFCTRLDPCREACTFGNDPRQLFFWVNSTCGEEAYGQENWKGVTVAKEVVWVSEWIPALFPWNWTVQPHAQPSTLATLGIQVTDPMTSSKPYLSVPPSGPGICNTSASEKLGVFAAVNIISAILLPILGRRTVVNHQQK